MALEARRRRIGGGERAIEIVDLVGRLDMPGAALLRNTVQEVLKEGCPRIAVNMAECVEIHREMMGTFHSLGRACIRAGGGLALFAATGDVLEYIRRFGDKSLAPWFGDEKAAVAALGGHVEPEAPKESESERPSVVAIGSDAVFRAVFWKLTALGGRPIAKFDSIAGARDYMARKTIHSILLDSKLSPHEIARFLRELRINSKLKAIGIFIIGPPSQLWTGRSLVQEGADSYVPLSFTGEEIEAKLDARTFFTRLKEIYDRFDARAKAKENP
jgi:hypothetical protein